LAFSPGISSKKILWSRTRVVSTGRRAAASHVGHPHVAPRLTLLALNLVGVILMRGMLAGFMPVD
jgi:hypothetical protein